MLLTPNTFFSNIFCINLKRRADRREYIEKEFSKFKIDAEFIEAVDGNDIEYKGVINRNSIDKRPMSNGDIGCILSHLKVCKIAKDRGYKNYLIFEDDAEFHPSFEQSFNDYISQVPKDWDMIYLGGSHMPHANSPNPQAVSENIAKIKQSYTSHAIALNERVYDSIISLWEKQDERIDICLSKIQFRFNCYAFRPAIVYQKAGHSDILNAEVDYKHLRK